MYKQIWIQTLWCFFWQITVTNISPKIKLNAKSELMRPKVKSGTSEKNLSKYVFLILNTLTDLCFTIFYEKSTDSHVLVYEFFFFN